jgi:pseudaminic acid synthase
MNNSWIPKKNKVLVVAELSANHNGSFETAIETIIAAKRCGADAIKLQTYTADSMTINVDKKDFIIKGTIWKGQKLYDLYQQAHTPWEWHEELFRIAREEGLICFSAPFDHSAVDFLEELNNPIYKIASFEITDIPLIDYVASTGKPIILSTGIATEEDINLALRTIRSQGVNDIALLKCTSSYPAPQEEANLIMIKDFKTHFGVIPGLSDHTLGITAPVVAVSLGAKIIEKHFILDKSVGGPDASFSLDQKEFTEMVKAIREAEKMIGEVSYKLTHKQRKGRDFSRSLYAVANIQKGEPFNKQNVRSIRPGFGLHPKYFNIIMGMNAPKSFEKGDPIKVSDDFLERT